jgi:hypothetical protein
MDPLIRIRNRTKISLGTKISDKTLTFFLSIFKDSERAYGAHATASYPGPDSIRIKMGLWIRSPQNKENEEISCLKNSLD